MFTLRPYQEDAVRATIRGLIDYKKPFLTVLPTGAGKSLVIAEVAKRLNQPTLILQPSREILLQNFAKLQAYGTGLDATIYSASLQTKEVGKFTFATIGSIYRQPENFRHFKYVLLDECHLLNPQKLTGMLPSFLTAIGCQQVAGFTATPYRLVNKSLWMGGQRIITAQIAIVNRLYPPFFRMIRYHIAMRELIDQGYLAPIDYYREAPDLSELVLNASGTDYTPQSLAAFWRPERLKRIVAAVQYAHLKHRRSLTFCSSLTVARAGLGFLTELGIEARLVSAETPDEDRARILADYRSGRLRHIFNVGVFTVGLDVPEIDAVIIARPTISVALWYQMVGRGVRLDPGHPDKRLSVYDLVGNIDRLGPVEALRLEREPHGFRMELHGAVGRLDQTPLSSFIVSKKK